MIILPSRGRFLSNPLAYPAGLTPGFDPTHIAAANTLVSAIASASNLLRVDSPKLATIAGTPTRSVGLIGSFVNYGATNNGGTAATTFTLNFTVPYTVAVICYISGIAGGTLGCIACTNSGNRVINYATSTGVLTVGGSGATPVALMPGFSYFIAQSALTTSVINYIAVNLNTGSTQFGTVAGTGSSSQTALTFGNNQVHADNMGGGIAAAMLTGSPMSLAALKIWAQAPWNFWYPQPQRYRVGASAAIAAVIQRFRTSMGIGQ